MSKAHLAGVRIETEEQMEELDLTEEDLRYLLERDRIASHLIPEGLTLTDLHEESIPLAQRANTGTVANMTTDELEAELEKRRTAQAENPNKPDDSHGSFADDEDDEEEDDDEDDEPSTPAKRAAKKAPAKKAAAAKKAASSSSDDEDDDDEDDED